MRRIIYISHTRARLPDSSLDALLLDTWERNRQTGITGLLLYKARSFFQVIEGPDAAVSALEDQIFSDPRHFKMKVLCRQQAAERRFAFWRMGYRRLGGGVMHHEAWFNLTRRTLQARIPETCAAEVLFLLRAYLEARLPEPPPVIAPAAVLAGPEGRTAVAEAAMVRALPHAAEALSAAQDRLITPSSGYPSPAP
jgi:hypothetical protein